MKKVQVKDQELEKDKSAALKAKKKKAKPVEESTSKLVNFLNNKKS